MTHQYHEHADRVPVRQYTRVRFGETENVCAHTRSWPGSHSE